MRSVADYAHYRTEYERHAASHARLGFGSASGYAELQGFGAGIPEVGRCLADTTVRGKAVRRARRMPRALAAWRKASELLTNTTRVLRQRTTVGARMGR